MAWDVEYTNEFEAWWTELDADERESVFASVGRWRSTVHSCLIHIRRTSRAANPVKLRELRIQHDGRPFRVFYAFNPLRTGLLLIGGDKTGDDRFYERMIPIADALFKVHLDELRKEGKIHDGTQEVSRPR